MSMGDAAGGMLSPRGVRMFALYHAHAEYSESMPPVAAAFLRPAGAGSRGSRFPRVPLRGLCRASLHPWLQSTAPSGLPTSPHVESSENTAL